MNTKNNFGYGNRERSKVQLFSFRYLNHQSLWTYWRFEYKRSPFCPLKYLFSGSMVFIHSILNPTSITLGTCHTIIMIRKIFLSQYATRHVNVQRIKWPTRVSPYHLFSIHHLLYIFVAITNFHLFKRF